MRSQTSGSLPRTFLLVFVAIGFVLAVAVRFELFRPTGTAAGSGNGNAYETTAAASAVGPTIQEPSEGEAPAATTPTTRAPRVGATATAIPSATATATATPSPTPTPLPRPVMTREVAAPMVSGASAAIVDELSGNLLYEKNAHARRAPASITKIVTAIVALERAKLGDLVTVRYDASELFDSTLMGLYPEDRISMEDLLYGLMLPSGNDAALAIARHIAGSERAFAGMMNAKVEELGLRDSHFVNPHGLDANGHYTSAYDITMVTRYAMRDATFRKLAAARSRVVTVYRGNSTLRWDVYNLNQMLARYAGADGVKIGYTEEALRTLVASATRDGHRVYATVMGSNNLWADGTALLDYAFKGFSWP